MCGSCRVTVDGKVKFACVDGPDFDGHKVDFKELIARQRRFKAQETTATEDYAHVCNLEKQLFEEEKRNYKKIKELAPHQTQMPERDALERAAQLQGGEPRLLAAGRPRRGRALHPVRQADLHRRLPGVDRHPALHPPPAGARPRRRARGHLRVEHLPVDLRPRLPAGVAVRGAVHHRQEDGVGRHRPARALRRRQRAGRPRRCRRRSPPSDKLGKVAIVGSGPAGLAVRRRPGALRRRRHRLRGAARGGRRAPLRHPVLPPAARHHRPRGAAARATWA